MKLIRLHKPSKTPIQQRIVYGLTLLELMITIAIAAILLTAVGPNIQSILVTNQVAGSINNVSSIIRFARNRAINEQTEVTVCPSSDFSNCATNWALPKIVFIDTDNNGQINGIEARLASTEPLPETLSVSGINGTLIFDDDGSTRDARSITICHNNNDTRFARAVLIAQFGRVSISADSNGDGVAEDVTGAALTCS
jgi:type IV fimbrial biogenesis protein FimT